MISVLLPILAARISSTAASVSLWLMPAVGSSSRMMSAPPAMVMPISSARCSAQDSSPAGRVAPVAELQPVEQPVGFGVQRLLAGQQVLEASSGSRATTRKPQRMFTNTVLRGKIEVIWKQRDRRWRLISCRQQGGRATCR